MKLSCLKLLNVDNSSEAEKVIQQQLIEWKKQPIGESSIESQLPAQKRKVFLSTSSWNFSYNHPSYFYSWIAS